MDQSARNAPLLRFDLCEQRNRHLSHRNLVRGRRARGAAALCKATTGRSRDHARVYRVTNASVPFESCSPAFKRSMHVSKSRISKRVRRLPRIKGFSHFARSNCRNSSLLPTYPAASSGERPRRSCEYFICVGCFGLKGKENHTRCIVRCARLGAEWRYSRSRLLMCYD